MEKNTVVYVCDGSSKKKEIGAGIIRRIEGKVYTYHFNRKIHDRWLDIHEHYAIDEVLNLIQKFGDKKVLIYNDDYRLIDQINKNSPRIMKNNPDLSTTESVLIARIRQMEESGYSITFLVCNDEVESEAHRMVHNLSRKYIKPKVGKKK